jgi:hypothetical protein
MGWLVSDKLETIWKEATVVWFEILFWYLPGRTEETKILSQDNRSVGMYSCIELGTSQIWNRSITSIYSAAMCGDWILGKLVVMWMEPTQNHVQWGKYNTMKMYGGVKI